MSFEQADALRRRAQRLRHLAETAESTPAMRLEHSAGVDTWRGPRPLDCVRLLWSAQRRIHHAAEVLRGRAWLLDRRADDIESAARLQISGS